MTFLKEEINEDILKLQTDDIVSRTRLLENEIKIIRSEIMRISHEHQSQKEKIKENKEKIKLNKTLPYLVSNVIEVRILYIILNT
jgi:26S proteasome regulatory subunit T5